MENRAMSRLRELNGCAPAEDVAELRKRIQIAEAEADKWRRLHASGSQALLACAFGLAVAVLGIVVLALGQRTCQ